MPRVVFSMSRALLTWLDIKLPWMPQENSKRRGMETLTSDESVVSWQCDIYPLSKRDVLIIAMEAHSRYSVLIPFTNPVPMDTLLSEILACWEGHFAAMAVNLDIVEEELAVALFMGFRSQDFHLECYQNSDRSLQGYIRENFYQIDNLLEDNVEPMTSDYIHYLEEELNSSPRHLLGRVQSEHRFLKSNLLRFAAECVSEEGLDDAIAQQLLKLNQLSSVSEPEIVPVRGNKTLH
ncbi:hypothetical protein CIG19_09040 [Enterobacterales bacterium CwR94]|nr:hypothetical protein CIG19_09040 [Enterobacterales bacterium CwR94]